MDIGIIGTGRVGSALLQGWSASGHDVQMAGRSTARSIEEVAGWADIIVLAVPFGALETVATQLGGAAHKTVIDCTNPIAMGPDGPGLALGHTTSGAEKLQSLLPKAHIVKTLNQVGAEIMADTAGFAQPPVQLIAGNDENAKQAVSTLVSDLGFEPLDAGGLAAARILEPFALVWINQAVARGMGRDWAFGALRRSTR